MNDPYVGTWRPHRPRGPIMAHFASPGPKYMLPGSTGHNLHDVRKNRLPAYSFGDRVKVLMPQHSPGPVYKIPDMMTRYGPDGSPIYTLKSKIKPLAKFNVPGPGTYAPEKSGPSAYYQAPKYSLHDRTRLAKKEHSPGANAYRIPAINGPKAVGRRSLPAYTMVGRRTIGSFHQDLQKSPGPATYLPNSVDVTKHRDPIYSVTGRNHPPLGRSIAPGPGQHAPEKVYVRHRYAPKHSFGIRHSEYIAPLMA